MRKGSKIKNVISAYALVIAMAMFIPTIIHAIFLLAGASIFLFFVWPAIGAIAWGIHLLCE